MVVASALVTTTLYLVQCRPWVVYGFTQVDEISLVLHLSDDLFGRKLRKYTLVLAGAASVAFLYPCELRGPLTVVIFSCPTAKT